MDKVLFVNHDWGSSITINQGGRNSVRKNLEGVFLYKLNDKKEFNNYLILGKYRTSLAKRGVLSYFT